MSGASEIFGFCILIHTFHGSNRTFCRRDSCSGADMIYGNSKSSFVIIWIFCYHLRELQFSYIFLRHWHTDKSFSVSCHKVNIFCCGKLCCTDKVSFILSVRIIRYQNNFSIPKFFQSFFYWIKSVHFFSPYAMYFSDTIYFSVVKRAKSFVLAAYLVRVRQIKHPLYSSASIE